MRRGVPAVFKQGLQGLFQPGRKYRQPLRRGLAGRLDGPDFDELILERRGGASMLGVAFQQPVDVDLHLEQARLWTAWGVGVGIEHTLDVIDEKRQCVVADAVGALVAPGGLVHEVDKSEGVNTPLFNHEAARCRVRLWPGGRDGL